ncbi:protein lin-37 homolog [Wyeomyia smithii]|uniref:protein lin-37 homolog n=1 Tax=Wyeomyia smithii TaxID=174621 RepID=UPI002467BBAC|nr:protein lin-37 homolog [Wyeomyia smithii]
MSKRRNQLDSAEKRRSLQNVALARGRLKGALQHAVPQSDNDATDESDSDTLDNVDRASKRLKSSATDSIPIPHQSYIMKLFDRSVDLARFDESTPLYPICRAWMQNQPRLNPNRTLLMVTPIKRERNTEMVEQYRNKELKEIRAMPKPEPASYATTRRCPSPLPSQTDVSKARIDLAAPPIAKTTLMAEHMFRWSQVRRKWQEHAKNVDSRYSASFKLLDAILQTNT